MKSDYDSPHSYALDLIPARARVLDLGCAGGYMGALLKKEKALQRPRRRRLSACRPASRSTASSQHDLNAGLPDVPVDDFDYILMLDVIEHLTAPEGFMAGCSDALSARPGCEARPLAPATSASS